MQVIEHIEVPSNQTSITFTDGGAWAGYTDLLIKYSSRTTDGGGSELLRIQFNGSTTSYSARQLWGDGTNVNSNTYASAYNAIVAVNQQGDGATANTFGNCDIYIPNFASSNNKSVSVDIVTENNATSAIQGLAAGLWSNTAAITSITLTTQFGTTDIKQYSSATLYGITAGSDGVTSVS